MEFYLVVLIFITCMIVLALLIYYCQEYRNPKYNFTDNQRDISSIALAIAAPGFIPSEYRSRTSHQPGFKPTYLSSPPPPGFVENGTPLGGPRYPPKPPPPLGFVENGNPLAKAPYPPKPPPREYLRAVLMPDEMSDSGSSSSDQIYYTPKTAAYSVAKRMSMSANAQALAKRMSTTAFPKGASISADVAAYLLAKRMSQTPYSKETNTRVPTNTPSSKNENTSNSHTNNINSTKVENAVGHSSNTTDNPLQQQNNKIVQHRSISPYLSDSTSTCSSASRTGNPDEPSRIENKRSASLYIPSAFHLKNRAARSGSLYSPLQNDKPCSREQSDSLPPKESESPCSLQQAPSRPKRTRQPSLKPTENHPLKSTENSSTRSENAPPQRSENISFPRRSESLPTKHSETLLPKRCDSLPSKRSIYSSDQSPFASSETSNRSHSPAPLHTVEEEE